MLAYRSFITALQALFATLCRFLPLHSVEERDEVLVYSTSPLDHDLEVTGPIRLEFFAASSALDTDFTAKLLDVVPDGTAINLTEGILRARYRDSQATPALLVPGRAYLLPAMSSVPATASGSNSPAATSRALIAT